MQWLFYNLFFTGHISGNVIDFMIRKTLTICIIILLQFFNYILV